MIDLPTHNPATDKAPGSCVNECLNTPPLPSPGGGGAAGGGGATAQSIQQEIKRRQVTCANLANLYRVNCATNLPYCGDGVCQQSEDPSKCPLDCRSRCGNGLCEHDENGSNCLKDCCTPEGDEMKSPDRLCCLGGADSVPYGNSTLLPYGKRCWRCAPEGFKPQRGHACCRVEEGQLYLIGSVCKLCADKGEALVPGAKCCEGKRLFEHDGICVYDPTCADTGGAPPVGGRCCNSSDGIVKGRCGFCADEKTDYVNETVPCCDGLDRVTDRAGMVRCVKRAPPNGGMPTNPCVATGQPCTPGTTQCCVGGKSSCGLTPGGKYLCP